MAGLSHHELQAEASRIRWYQSMDLGQGVRTQGLYDPAAKIHRYHLPDDLSGKSVLDVGAWDGFWSFEAERRGASRVLATDSYVWAGKTWGSKAGFELARRALGSSVEDMQIDVLELTPQRVGKFDVVLFLGVLYHMRHPMLALQRVASVTTELLIVETAVDMVHVRRPALALYPGSELGDDPTNWFGPNPPAVVGMLRSVGFSRVETMAPRNRLHVLARSVALRALGRQPRMVFHAYR
jgi:tRNA (mo5U34)-methyltransferase